MGGERAIWWQGGDISEWGRAEYRGRLGPGTGEGRFAATMHAIFKCPPSPPQQLHWAAKVGHKYFNKPIMQTVILPDIILFQNNILIMFIILYRTIFIFNIQLY